MRKALFAVVLVSASFAGGAVVNGPGLRWAQTMVMNRLGIEGDDEPVAAPADEMIPVRPIPPLVVEPQAPGKAAVPVAEASRPERARKRETPPPSDSQLPGLAPVPDDSASPLDKVPPLTTASHDPEPDTPPLAAASPSSTPSPSGADREKTADRAKERDKGDDPSVRRASLASPGGDDKAASPAEAASATADAAPTAADPAPASPGGDWAEVRDTMRKLGVSRYGVDGDPSGRVRFHCVIPLAGRRAVGQHFEAEGDDDLQAARSALKRVALWKAAGDTP